MDQSGQQTRPRDEYLASFCWRHETSIVERMLERAESKLHELGHRVGNAEPFPRSETDLGTFSERSWWDWIESVQSGDDDQINALRRLVMTSRIRLGLETPDRARDTEHEVVPGKSDTSHPGIGDIDKALPPQQSAATHGTGDVPEDVVSQFESALASGESEFVEFMERFARDQFLQTACAFANTSGGWIYVGVHDPPTGSRQFVGADETEINAFVAELDKYFDEPLPQLGVHVFIGKYGPRPLVAIEVRKSSALVALADLTIWRRKGNENTSHEARTRPNRSKPKDVVVSDDLALNEELQATKVAAESPLKPEDGVKTDASVSQVGTDFDLRREARDSEKCLNVDAYADALAGYFEAAGDAEMCFGLFGHWGRGKTFLVRELARRLELEGYATVRFSAWKYRTTPELWAYLYETIAATARRSMRFPWVLPIRFGLARFRVWPLTWALVLFGCSLWAFSEWRALLIQVLGLSGLGLLSALAVRFRTHGQRLQQRYAALASHRETLGLQAAIGDDLRALLIAWMPRDHWITDRGHPSFWSWWDSIRRNGLAFSCYLLATVLVTFHLHPARQTGGELAEWVVCTVWIVWLLLAYIVPWLLFFADTRIQRLFLYVDDLDRCPTDRMLEIIESLMLMLDDEEVKRRVQVCMLVEEESIDHALRVKYGHLMTGGDGLIKETESRYVIRENLEKLFLAHLRLPRVGTPEVTEILTKYLGAPRNPEPTRGAAQPVVEVAAARDAVPAGGATTNQPPPSRMRGIVRAVFQGDRPHRSGPLAAEEKTKKRVKALQETVPFSDSERLALLSVLPKLTESKHPGRWSPRAVRCLLSRYQLARVLLRSLKIETAPERLATALVLGTNKLDGPTEKDKIMAAVVEQVQ